MQRTTLRQTAQYFNRSPQSFDGTLDELYDGYVRDLFPAQDGNTDYLSWTREDLARRFVPNVHPCNLFLLPTPMWRAFGDDLDVLAFMYAQLSLRYASVWDEFSTLAGAQPLSATTTGPVPCHYDSTSNPGGLRLAPSHRAVKVPTVTYRAAGLVFKANVIDALADEDEFRIESTIGVFQMSKRDFLLVFPNVDRSASYRIGRVYGSTTAPSKAMRFQIAQQGGSACTK